MKNFTAIAAAAALLASAGIASAEGTLPLNPNKSTQTPPSLAGLVGTQVAAGTIIGVVVVGSLVVLTISDDDSGTVTTSTVDITDLL